MKRAVLIVCALALLGAATATMVRAGNLPSGASFTGGNGPDRIDGTVQADDLHGGGANDLLRGGGGLDTLYGDTGDDTLIGDNPGQDYADSLYGGDGGDELAGGDGDDYMEGGPGDDRIGSLDFNAVGGVNVIELGNDALLGQEGDDTLTAGPGNDDLNGGPGADVLAGGDGNDKLNGGNGQDIVKGDDGNDTITNDGDAPDAIDGGNGDDTIKVRNGQADVVVCGAGTDTVTADAADDVAADCENVDKPAGPAPTPWPTPDTPAATPTPDPGPAATPAPKPVNQTFTPAPGHTPPTQPIATGTKKPAAKVTCKTKKVKGKKTKVCTKKVCTTKTVKGKKKKKTCKTVKVKAPKTTAKAKKASVPSDVCTGDLNTALTNLIGGNGRLFYGKYLCSTAIWAPQGASGLADLQSKVQSVLDSCGAGNRLLVAGVIYWTGRRPTVGSNACMRNVYETVDTNTWTGSGNPPGVDWNLWPDQLGNGKTSAYTAVGQAMNLCIPTQTSLAIIESLDVGGYPNRGAAPPEGGRGSQFSGQCHPGLYKAANYDFAKVKGAAGARNAASTDCSNSLISSAATSVVGSYPLATTPTNGECALSRYPDWDGSLNQMKTRFYAAQTCDDPWIGQIYAVSLHRGVRGLASAGECNKALYGTYSDYATLKSRITNLVAQVPRANNARIEEDGGITRPDGQFIEAQAVRVIKDNGDEFDGLGRLIAVGAGHVIAVGAGHVIAVGAGHAQMPQGAAVIAVGAGHVIAVGAGHVIAVGAGHLWGDQTGNWLTQTDAVSLAGALPQIASISASQLGQLTQPQIQLGGWNVNGL